MNELTTIKAITLSKKCKVYPTGLEIDESTTFKEWCDIGITLKQIGRTHTWCVGDWINFGHRKYLQEKGIATEGRHGKLYTEALSSMSFEYGSLRTFVWVSSTFKLSRRRDNLTWSHHRDVAGLDEELQDYFLSEADKHKLNRNNFRSFIKQEIRKQQLENVGELTIDESIQVIHGDVLKPETLKDIESESIDSIITDPPYPAEYLPCWETLAWMGLELLKPSGFLIAYSGQMNLDEVFKIFHASKQLGLKYYWTAALMHSDKTQIVDGRNVIPEWKPILIFQKKPFKILENTLRDKFDFGVREKELHEWQQGEDDVAKLVEHFTKPGDLILDPFAGSGTTLAAAYKLKRRAIGIEINEQYVKQIKVRLNKIENEKTNPEMTNKE